MATRKTRQLIALGGGGFSMEENPALDQYVLAQSSSAEPTVTFIPTASGDSEGYIELFYTAFAKLPCRPSHLSLFSRTPDLRELLAQDILYVGGGNTKTMLGVWREWGLPEVLREAWAAGVVIAGISAGAICWFEQGLTDSFAGSLRPLECLGFLAGSCCPHYDGDPARRPTYHAMQKSGDLMPGLAIDDGVALHFVDDDIHRVVASRPGVTAYRVGKQDGKVREKALPVELLAAR
ncbi:MAG TPA: peptidase E [Thermoanaerobaculia bacterium]|jgi:peptidase E|nr:peptidase E [Thermoanaerobaculia bacterium]